MANLTSTWKTYLQTYPSRSLLSLKSLWELIYDDNGDLLADSAKTLTTSGCALDHNIICYATNAYPSGPLTSGTLTYGSKSYTPENAYELLGIDVSIAQYDTRTKARYVDCDATIPASCDFGGIDGVASQKGTPLIFRDGKFKCYDKNAALRPSNSYDFAQHGVLTKIIDNITGDNYITGSSASYIAPNVIPIDSLSDSTTSLTAPIYLNKADTSFKGTLTTDTTISAYDLILLNPYNNIWTATLVLKALYSQIAYDTTSSNSGGFLNSGIVSSTWYNFFHDTWVDSPSTLVNFVFQELPGYINGNSANSSMSVSPTSKWADLLKHTFVWVKAPFFGDYIQPDVFNQDLSQSSNVVHKNIVLSDAADFNKYDETTDSSSNSDTDTYPYIPVTSPTIDLITPKIYNSINGTSITYTDLSSLDMGSSNTLSSNIENIITEGDKNEDSAIGSLNFVPNLRNTKANGLRNYFDPEFEYAASDMKSASNKLQMPTIIPSSGNIYADGRIISPTIDELWVYLKQLTEGRRSDSRGTATPAENDSAYAVNTDKAYKIDSDTVLKAAAKKEYYVNENYIGDITSVDVSYDSSNRENKLTVTEWVNNNKSIKYNIYNALKRISTMVTTFDLSKGKSRAVTEFTPWTTTDSNTTEVLKDSEMASNGGDDNNIWQPRAAAPYSLRELEAISQGNKYNLITLARFIENNFSIVGPLGYKYFKDETTDSIGTTVEQAAGSLYQFHRDYNYRMDNPNTFFRKGGEGKSLYNDDGTKNIETSGVDASFYDLQAEGHTDETNIKLYNSTSAKTSKMPLLVENYGKSVYLDTEFGDYSGADIYMAADGTWRYKAEHSRVPILRSRY